MLECPACPGRNGRNRASRTGVVSRSGDGPRRPGCAASAGGRAAPTSTGSRLARRRGAGRLAHRVGQRLEVVAARPERVGVRGEPQHLPATRGGQPLGVGRAQVVAVRLGVGGQRAEDGRRVGVDVGERGDRRATAGGPRTAADGAHGRTVPDGGHRPANTPARWRGLRPRTGGDGPGWAAWLAGREPRRPAPPGPAGSRAARVAGSRGPAGDADQGRAVRRAGADRGEPAGAALGHQLRRVVEVRRRGRTRSAGADAGAAGPHARRDAAAARPGSSSTGARWRPGPAARRRPRGPGARGRRRAARRACSASTRRHGRPRAGRSRGGRRRR